MVFKLKELYSLIAEKTVLKIKEYASEKLNILKRSPKARKKFTVNYLVPAVAALTLVFTVAYWMNTEFALDVKYNGELMATIENEAVLEKAHELLNNQRAVPEEDTTVPITYELTRKSPTETEGSAYSVFNKIVDMNGALANNAVGLYIDGNFIGAAENSAGVADVLGTYLKESAEKNKNSVSAEFVNEIQYSAGVYPLESVYSAEKLAEKALKVLETAIVEEKVYTEEISYGAIYQEDSSLYKGTSQTVKSGKNGSQNVTVRNKYVNGELFKTEVLDVKIISEPIDEIISVGTKEVGIATGSFTWPVPYTTEVSSEFGWRWGKLHKGLDVASNGCYGADIVAADGGVVTWSGYDDSGYGYHVIIDHGNGYKTLYAHCSDLYVSTGDKVGKGQSIAAIGSSGDVTGTHLHFEIYSNGSPVDPRDYL